MSNQQQEPEELVPEAEQMIDEVLGMVSVPQLIAYLEQTGWTLFANEYTRGQGWSLNPENTQPWSLLYTKADPTEGVVEVPTSRERSLYHSKLQGALERIALVEETTFVTIVCRVLNIHQIVLKRRE